MTTKTIIAIAAISLTTITGAAQAGYSLGGTGEFGDVYAQSNPGERISQGASASPASGAIGRAAFGTRSGASQSANGGVLQFGSAYLGGVGAYGDIYPLTDPGSRAR